MSQGVYFYSVYIDDASSILSAGIFHGLNLDINEETDI